MIHEPSKDDYEKLSAHSIITLLSCMGKITAKIIAELLLQEFEWRVVLSDDSSATDWGILPSMQQPSHWTGRMPYG